MQMRKSILSSALLAGMAGVTSFAFVAPAMAETSVTLYGLLDSGLQYQNVRLGSGDANNVPGGRNSQSRFGMGDGQESGSRWGLKGTEDLGGGTSAVFVLESGFSTRDGTEQQGSRLFGRQSTIGLTNDAYGRLDFGRQTNLASNYFSGIDPFQVDFVQANMGTAFSSVNTVRYDNMVMYQSPVVLGGWQGGVGYSFNLDNLANPPTGFSTTDSSRAVTTGITYTGGPINFAMTYDEQFLSPSQPKPKAFVIGGSYDFSVVKLGLAYGRTKDGTLQGQAFDVTGGATNPNIDFGNTDGSFTMQGLTINSYMVGASAPIGASTSLLASWQRASPNMGLDKLDVFSLGSMYTLSKRTNLYAFASYAQGVAFVEGTKETTVGVGFRHQF
jgi:GBP family porin